ncbi:hypothetical protein PPMP20_00555 [Paraburkholderia phymatum]|uniref:Uncharacterized protein n=1 Tax=Paraburkholderia phymatum (strain DSM 17167 / CIP 108236 / LMG 21445 / STM815) TaxID=391038 RepID=B2JVG9_PARP8|nr:hypothetical protein [Paraburkholderia phymatum]ACC74946.1 hypothetical protein Bphy_5882 [Paraburkholderia phymatum STM815]
MKRSINWDLIETRESIRQSAYDLARSGLCDAWQDVWRALRARFSVDQLAVIFDNPLCRLDIDQRCYRARNPGKVAREVQTDLDAIRQRAAPMVLSTKPAGLNGQKRRSERLASRIETLLADGSQCTAVELAERLGTSRNEILIAARDMLADGTLQVARYVASSRGGRGARVFVRTGASAPKDHAPGLHSTWPQADSVVADAFDAIARCR